MMSPCQELTDQVSHLKAVFEACDRDRKGYITSDDVSAVTQHMPQDEREMLLELLGTVHGTLDYQTFWKRVNKILESGKSSEIPKNKQNVLDNSTEFTLSSPFKPPYNSSLASPDAAKEDNADLGKDDQSVDDQKVVEEEGSREELELLEAGSYRDNRKVFSARGIRPTRIFSDCNSSEPSLKSGVYPRFGYGALCPTTARDLSASNDSLVLRDFRTSRDSEFSSLGSPTDTAKLVQQEVEHQISIKMKEEMEQQLSSMKSAMNQINETARQSRNDVFSLMDLVSNMNIGKGESISNGKEVEQLKQSNDLQTLKLEEMVMVVKDVKEELSKKTKHTDNHLEHKMEDMKNKYDGKIEDLHKVLELNEELTAMKLKVENMKSQMMLLEVRKMSEQEEIEDSKNRIAREREELRKEKEKLSFEKQELKTKSKELSLEREELMAEKQMIQFGIGFLKHEKEKSGYQKTLAENDTTDNIIGMFDTTSNDKTMAKEILKISQLDNSMATKLFSSPSLFSSPASSPVLRPRREKRQTDFYLSPTSTPSPTGRRMISENKINNKEENVYEVTCKESKGEFHHDKFISGGKGLSIFFNDTWMTPGAFEKLAGSKAKKYKESLYVNGQKIIKLIDPNGTGQTTPSCRPRLTHRGAI